MKFKTSYEQVKKFSRRPPDKDLLELHSLYKQATIGNVNIPMPSTPDGKRLWEAWSTKKGVTQSEAKEKYIAKVKILAVTYA
ncbi:acyl-CoA-binding protein-like isoform X3 [Diorhabda sublineata]|uniref:acyl-CoA-binding protein-like isoform X2 n=1 Tax=Diorhabda sublineata TaxID=1163346 RepID=UPI0024E162BB|nr:acyl-CoA-binding protein-like isoform X2 [Diorhabda sublineata]XP_056632428.1 acyl-CoA-binding protein-like isoform X3 [Diorhabda sublineata]